LILEKHRKSAPEPIDHNLADKEELLIWLMEEYGNSVTRIAYTYVKEKSLAEDVAQDVFIKCYENLESFRSESSYKTWIYRITVNKCKDVLRSWTFKNIIPTEIFSFKREQEIAKTNKSNSPEQITISNEKSRDIAEVVLTLPIKLREVVILYYYEEQKLDEVANLLNLNINTVKTRLLRARKQLKRLMGGNYFE
jgi:RNA polymerase sigma factor (sigma-70 family)